MNEFQGLTEAELAKLLELVPKEEELESLEPQLVTALTQLEAQLLEQAIEVSLQLVDLKAARGEHLVVTEPCDLIRLQPAGGSADALVMVPRNLTLGIPADQVAELLLKKLDLFSEFTVVSQDSLAKESIDWKLLSANREWIEAHVEFVQSTTYSTLRLFLPSGTHQRGEQPVMTENKEHQPTIERAQFTNLTATPKDSEQTTNLDMLLDIPLQVTVELGRTRKTVKEVLEIAQGSIIELDKLAGEPVDILVNQKLIAVGEVVVIDEQFGIRVTDISSQADRLAKLR